MVSVRSMMDGRRPTMDRMSTIIYITTISMSSPDVIQSNTDNVVSPSPSPEEIIALAKSVGYQERRPTTSMTLFFIDNPSYGVPPCRINIYYTTRSIMTCLSHPSSSDGSSANNQKTNELWRSNAYDTLEELLGLFLNPRIHTGKGYRNANKAVRGCAACGEMKTRTDFSRNQWTKGPDVNKCIDCVNELSSSRSVSNLITGLENTTLNENGGAGVVGLTLDNLNAHNQITNSNGSAAGSGQMERRQFNCPACPQYGRGPNVFFKKVPAMKPLVKCPKCKQASQGRCKRLYPVPKGGEKGYGLFKCGKCADFWGSSRAVSNIGQECHGCKKNNNIGIMVTPFRLEVLKPQRKKGGGGGGRRVPREPIGEDQVEEREYGDADRFRNDSGGADTGAADPSYEIVSRDDNEDNDNRSDSWSVVGLSRPKAPSGYQHSCAGCQRGLCKNRSVPVSEIHDVSDGNTVSTRNSIVTNSSVDKTDYIDRDLDFEEEFVFD
jgi:hypothetical protein